MLVILAFSIATVNRFVWNLRERDCFEFRLGMSDRLATGVGRGIGAGTGTGIANPEPDGRRDKRTRKVSSYIVLEMVVDE